MKRAALILLIALVGALTASAQLTITTSSVPEALPGQPYTPVSFTAINGGGALSWSIAGPSPPGFIMTTGGVFCFGVTGCSNNPVVTANGLYSFRVRVNDQQGQIAFASITLSVNGLQIVTQSLPFATVNQSYSFLLAATGTDSFFWFVDEMSSLPEWLSLSSDGILTGIPPVTGPVTFTVDVADDFGQVVARQFTLYVTQGPLQIAPITLPGLSRGVLFQTTVTATGGLPPFQWGLQASPQGMAINPFTGDLAWTPSANGSFSFTVVVRDQTGTSVTRLFLLNVADPPVVTTTSLPSGVINVPYPATQVLAVGGQVPYIWNTSGALPTGLALDGTLGIISGTPTQFGTFPFILRVIDAGQRVATMALSITVTSSGFSITTTSLKDAVVAFSYSQALSTSGGTAPFTWSIVSGALPNGFSINPASGVIGGTTTAAGTTSFTVQAKEAGGSVAQRAYTLFVDAAPLFATTPQNYTVRGQSIKFLTISGGRPPYAFSVVSGVFPGTVQVNPTTGVVTATPNTLGLTNFTYVVSDAGQNSLAPVSLGLIVVDPIVITTTALTGTVGVPFNQTLAATGGLTQTLHWAFRGAFPPGLSANSLTGAISGTPTNAGSYPVPLTATDVSSIIGGQGQSVLGTITITINSLPPTSATVGVGNTTQPPVSVTLGSSYPVDVTGTLMLSFNSAFGGGDDMKKFSNGSLAVGFTIPAGSTQATFPSAPNASVIPGTVAGTITLTAFLQAAGNDITPDPPPTKTIVINPSIPVITSVTVQQVSGGINVIVEGASSTREISSGLFHFTVTSGNTLTQSDITVALTSAYTTWFNSAASNATGGEFKLTMPFTISSNSTAVKSVTVTLTNQQGNSAAVASQ